MAGRGRVSRAGTDASTVPALDACLLCGAPHIVCKWTCTRMCTRMVMRTEAKGLPPGLHHRRCGCRGRLCSTALRACCGDGVVTVAAFRYNMVAHVLWHIRFCLWVLFLMMMYILPLVFIFFYQKDFMVMYSCNFTYECVFYYVLGQRWPNKQLK